MSNHIRTTADGSVTLFSDIYNECYHSAAGAVAESMHVFIDAGLRALNREKIKVFEVGFGTGLNAFLTLQDAEKQNLIIDYTTVELNHVEKSILEELSLTFPFSSDISLYNTLHQSVWNQPAKINDNFSLTKIPENLLTTSIGEEYDLIYFDAFSPAAQPELWTEEVFIKMYNALAVGGLLKPIVQREMLEGTCKKLDFLLTDCPGCLPREKCCEEKK